MTNGIFFIILSERDQTIVVSLPIVSEREPLFYLYSILSDMEQLFYLYLLCLRWNHCYICILLCLKGNHCSICSYCVWEGTNAISVLCCVRKGTIVLSYPIVSEREPLFYLIPVCLRGNHCSILSYCVWEGIICKYGGIYWVWEGTIAAFYPIVSEREPLFYLILLCLRGNHCYVCILLGLRGNHCSILSYCVWEGTIALSVSY